MTGKSVGQSAVGINRCAFACDESSALPGQLELCDDWAENLCRDLQCHFEYFAALVLPGTTMEKTILIVDDDELICNLLRNLFKRYQLNVITAFDGIEAIEQTLQHDPDLILLDIKMPKKDGLTVLGELRSMPKYAEIPIIILSAKDQLHEVRAGLDAGATGYLRKPMTSKEIAETVLEYL